MAPMAAYEGGRQFPNHFLGAKRDIAKRSSRRTPGTPYDRPALFNLLLPLISVSLGFSLSSGIGRHFPKRSLGVRRLISKRFSRARMATAAYEDGAERHFRTERSLDATERHFSNRSLGARRQISKPSFRQARMAAVAAYKSDGRRHFPKPSLVARRHVSKRSSRRAPGTPYDPPPYAVRGLLWGCHLNPMKEGGSRLVDPSSGSNFLFFADSSLNSTFGSSSIGILFDPMDVDYSNMMDVDEC